MTLQHRDSWTNIHEAGCCWDSRLYHARARAIKTKYPRKCWVPAIFCL